MELFMCFLAIAAGMTMSVQAGINSQLQIHWAQSPILAAFISFIVGLVGLVILLLATRTPIPPLPEKLTLWHWSGGLLGAFFVTVTVFVAPRLGATTMVALFLAGQVGISLFLDHFGVLGYAQKSLSWQRLFGAMLVAGGVFMIRKF